MFPILPQLMDLCSRDKGRARKDPRRIGYQRRKVDQTIDLCLRLPSIDAKATRWRRDKG